MATWAETTLCEAKDVREYITDYGIALIKSGEEKPMIDRKIAIAKNDFIKPHLQELLVKVYADTVDRWIALATSKRDDERLRSAKFLEQSGYTGVLPPINNYSNNAPFFLDFLGQQTMPPRTYYNYGTPTSGTSGSFAGTAVNGSFLVDYQNGQLYINAGTTASPTWSAFVAEDLIDKIANPSVLKRSAIACVIWLVLEDGAMRDNASFDRNLELLGGLTKKWYGFYEKWIEQDQTLLKIDISGNGIISEYERTRLRRGTAWIA